MYTLFSTMLALLLPFFASAQVLFEGYYKIQSENENIGYSIQRYESLENGQKFKATVFVKTNVSGGNLTESIVTLSDAGMNPVKMNYTAIIGNSTKIIDAEVKNGNLVAEIRDGNKPLERKQLKIEPGVFFSGILIYSILKTPKGLVPETQYNYKSIAEETFEIVNGKAIVQDYEDFQGKIRSLKVLNEFRNMKFYSWVTDRGEVLKTAAPSQGVVTFLVPNREEATKGHVVPEKSLRALFGNIPLGENNTAYRAHKKGEWPSQDNEPSGVGLKKQLVPTKTGIKVK